MLDFFEIMRGYDLGVLRWLNSWAFWRPWMDALIVFRAVFFGYWIVAGLLVFGFAAFWPRFSGLRKKNWEMIFVALFSAAVARFGLAELVRYFYSRPRPFEILPEVHQLIFRDGGGAFPSGHAVFSFAIAAVVARYYPKTSILFFLAALNMSLARVQAGIHWPSDILGGAIIGVAVGWLASKLYSRYASRFLPAV